MVDVDSTADRTGDVTTVRVLCTNTYSTTQRIRIGNALEGPTWPPTRDGVVDPRWDGDCWEGVIRPGRTIGIGFATPAPPASPLIEVVSSDRVDPASETGPDVGVSERLATLDGWRPDGTVLEGEPDS